MLSDADGCGDGIRTLSDRCAALKRRVKHLAEDEVESWNDLP